MPLLHRKPFSKNPVPRGLRDTDEVFYCELTKEIFLSYEHYVERIILCNSLVWSCELTGKKNMTYKEALDCELDSKKMLNDFPNELQKPILYLLSLTKCSSLKELIEQIFNYVRYRYFVSEIVDVALEQDQWLKCRVLAVHAPSDQKIAERNHHTPKKSNDSNSNTALASYSYDVELLSPKKKQNPNIEPIYRVDGVQIRRSKACFTRDRCRFFITHNVEFKNGLISLKDNVASSIANLKFEDIFSGESPQFSETKKNKVLAKNGLTKKCNKLMNGGEPSKKDEKTMLETVEKLKEEKLKIKEKRKEEKEKLSKFMKEWNKKKEDLELEDLKELPNVNPVNLRVPNEHFGDFVMIYEFFHNFWSQLDAGSYFPQGMNIELLERCLIEEEITGPLNTLVQVLLTTIFDLEEDEEADMKDSHISGCEPVYNISDNKTKTAVKLATDVRNWSIQHLGQQLNKITLQPTVISEVLRIHILSSGGKYSDRMTKWIYHERGNYCPTDDPGLTIRLEHPEVLAALSHHHISCLPIADKIMLINCLMNQILTFSSYRIQLLNTVIKLKNDRLEVRSALAAEKKKTQEIVQKKKEMKLLNGEAQNVETSDQKAINNRLNEWNKKLSDLTDLGMTAQILPLGTDRAFRKYWMFASMPGLFIEDDEPYPGTCLPNGTPINNINENDPVSYVKKLFEMNEKENVSESRVSLSNTPSKKRLLDDTNNTSFMTNGSYVDQKRSLLRCFGPDSQCPVHDNIEHRLAWGYYNTPDELDGLINNLNSRGLREGELKKVLIQEKPRILSSMEKCTNCLLNPSLMVEDDKKIQKRLKTDFSEFKKLNVKFLRLDPDVDTSMELTLREYILYLERRLNTSALGSIGLKFSNRDQWRENISNGIYKVPGQLSWGNRSKVNDDNSEKASSPELINYQDPVTYIVDVKGDKKIFELASVILKLEQSIEPKFLRRPLGFDKKEKMSSAINPLMDKWEMSLMNSLNFSQLFLHLITLEKSIEWSKSIMKVNCVLCRSNKDEDVMLLCDNCNKGHHIYCLKPKLKKIPQGDWFCQKCVPIVKHEVEEDEPEEKVKIDICYICKEEGTVITCDDCLKNYHLACLNPPKRAPPKRNWTCFSCRQTSCKDELEQVEVERYSRRKSSQAATAKISEFARQLLHASARCYGEEENITEEKSRRRGRHTEQTTLTTSEDLPLDNALLQLLLNQVMHHPDAWPFLRPVTKSQCPDYHTIIKTPMDLGTVKYKLNMLSYGTNADLLSDMELIFENCFYYNSENSEVFKCGEQVYNYYKKLCQECNLKDFSEDGVYDGPPLKKSKHSL
ncbi:bromodomain adjacent to zinc finger domain protein 1A-like isoform X1 [Myzus persicae]|uniref:bromodomain adjacent to zinc finger domain protein 1A-like isoform X1 n=1 Tax=Myzus persicae TaxID=13164 RepID=UPI000B93230A|nr:bromodomain adjacent to zinc finger domain protein 1A-like isoform X1 [Myzus persicae]